MAPGGGEGGVRAQLMWAGGRTTFRSGNQAGYNLGLRANSLVCVCVWGSQAENNELLAESVWGLPGSYSHLAVSYISRENTELWLLFSSKCTSGFLLWYLVNTQSGLTPWPVHHYLLLAGSLICMFSYTKGSVTLMQLTYVDRTDDHTVLLLVLFSRMKEVGCNTSVFAWYLLPWTSAEQTFSALKARTAFRTTNNRAVLLFFSCKNVIRRHVTCSCSIAKQTKVWTGSVVLQ